MKTFVSAAAQPPNLGDMVLRRNIAAWIRDAGAAPHVYVGGMPSEYVAALELDGDTLYDTQARWVRAILRSCLRGRTGLVFAPGPQELKLGRANVIHAIVNLVLAALVRTRGGVVVKVGRSLVGESCTMLALERGLARLCTIYAVRDQASAPKISKAIVAPDLAVTEGSRAAIERRVVGLSFRWDRPLPRSHVDALIKWANANSLEPTFVTQVWWDNDEHARLADELGVGHVAWTDRDHSAQLSRLADVYARTAYMFSDRLHSLILAWNEGAVPLGWSRGASSKIATHLDAHGMREYIVNDDASMEDFLQRRTTDFEIRSGSQHARMVRARDDLRSRVIDVLRNVNEDVDSAAD